MSFPSYEPQDPSSMVVEGPLPFLPAMDEDIRMGRGR